MKLLIISGPTASGKTNVGVHIAKQMNGEIISADSRQIYQYMDIITGKDAIKRSNASTRMATSNNVVAPLYEKDGIPIWLYDVVKPDQEFSVSHYVKCFRDAADKILAKGKLPILVGGSGFYIDAAVRGIDTIDIPPNVELRNELEQLPLDAIQTRLRQINESVWEHMNNSDRGNRRRLIRKIEVNLVTTFPEVYRPAYDTLWIGLSLDRFEIIQRISHRIEKRIQQGAVSEVQWLLDFGYSWTLPSMQTIGYKEWKNYFENRTPSQFEIAVSEWRKNEIAYAKRQMTWLKPKKEIIWFKANDEKNMRDIIQKVSSWYNSQDTYAKNY